MSNKKLTQSEIYKIRYHLYKKVGYSTEEATIIINLENMLIFTIIFRLIIFITNLKNKLKNEKSWKGM